MDREREAVAEKTRRLRATLLKSTLIVEDANKTIADFGLRVAKIQQSADHIWTRYKALDNIDSAIEAGGHALMLMSFPEEVEPIIVKGPSEDLDLFIENVNHLSTSVDFLRSHVDFKKEEFYRACSLLDRANVMLIDEFKLILSRNSIFPELDRLKYSLVKHGEDLTLPVLFPRALVPQLHAIVARGVGPGHQEKCFKAYNDLRSSILEETLGNLGFERLSTRESNWKVQEVKIRAWSRCLNLAVRILIPAEMELCKQVFNGLPDGEYSFVTSVSKNCISMLLREGLVIANISKSSELFFVYLDTFAIVEGLLPEITDMFTGEVLTALRKEANALVHKLVKSVWDLFDAFLASINRHVASPPPSGTLDTLTTEVTSSLSLLYDYKETVSKLLQPVMEENTDITSLASGTNTFFAKATVNIMNRLETNLRLRSNQYEDLALRQLFLMNNLNHMVQVALSKTEVCNFLGKEWIKEKNQVVSELMTNYVRNAWNKVIQFVSEPRPGSGLSSPSSSGHTSGHGLGLALFSPSSGSNKHSDPASGEISRSNLKERYKSFNTHIEEIHQKQSQWSVPDNELRSTLRISIQQELLTAYGGFTTRHRNELESGRTRGKNIHKYIKYSTEDLERMIYDLFEGRSVEV